MHIYFLKLNVLDTPGQSVWNHDERKIPDKVKISFVNTFLFERILFIISVSKYTYIGKINCAQYGYESYAQKSWNFSFLIIYHILAILCRDIHSIWMDLCTHGLVDCCFYRGCLHSFIFVDREMCCCYYNWCRKFQPHTHKCINTYYVNWKVLTIHLLPQQRKQSHF